MLNLHLYVEGVVNADRKIKQETKPYKLQSYKSSSSMKSNRNYTINTGPIKWKLKYKWNSVFQSRTLLYWVGFFLLDPEYDRGCLFVPP